MTAKPSFGCVVKIGSTSTPSTTLTNVIEVSPPKATRDAVDATVHDSAGGAMEFIADGVYDPGDLQITMNYIAGDTNDVACLAALAATGDYYFQFSATGSTGTKTFTSKGVVTSYGPETRGVKGKQTATMSVKLSGPMTVA
ncbi:phage tail tube protein [Novosphingobium sp.]|uniref:phage tail tube protein n=1 Tax=Novosphingobium sp. TaxID=1874826 RepID=UPI0038B70434